MEKQALFFEEITNELYPAFVVDEESKQLVFVNGCIQAKMGDVTGRTCHEVFFGNATPCSFCPQRQEDGQCYAWECYGSSADTAYKVSTLWKRKDGTLYRLTMGAAMDEIVRLNRSVVDYLGLMQQLSQMQVGMMDQPANALETILTFLYHHTDAESVTAIHRTENTLVRYLCDGAGVRVIPEEAECSPEGELVVLQVLDEEIRFFLNQPRRKDEWEESRGTILSIVKLYLENGLLRRRVEWENTHDRATLLYNRAAFRNHTRENALDWQELTVVFLDIDNLKTVNDTYGHDMGDRIICKVAQALAAKADETDEGVRAYRIGGDEFVLLCRCDQKRGELLCGEVRELLREGNAHDITPPVCVSMGLAHGRAPLEVEALLRQADGRMYEEKRKNKESLR